MHIITFITPAFCSNAQVVENHSPPPAHGEITNMDAPAKNYFGAKAATNASYLIALFNNITGCTQARNYMNVSMANATIAISIHRTWIDISPHIRTPDSTVICVTNPLVRSDDIP